MRSGVCCCHQRLHTTVRFQNRAEMKLIEVHYEKMSLIQEKPEAMGRTMQQISTDFHDVFTGEGKFEKKRHLELDTNIEPMKQPVTRIPVAMKPKL